MTIKEQLLQEIESSPDNLLEQTLDFLKFLKTRVAVETDNQKLSNSTGKNLLEHLKKIGTWEGDDLEECWKSVKETRAIAKFKASNAFDPE